MRIYDTNRKAYREFKPPQLVSIYVCGITPYDAAHLGHIFTFMTYDLLQRRLEDIGHEVRLVRNITDVDEPIYVRAKELGTDYVSLANSEIDSFHTVLDALHFRPTYAEPKASDYITQMAETVKTLVTSGHAYYVNKDIYFDTSSYPDFGAFSGYSQSLQRALMADRGGNPELEAKRQPLDFLLWRQIDDPDDPAQWQTVVGRGRPGWHIECSVMSSALLGEQFDLHGGGSDLIFPHHECEIAQSEALHAVVPAKYWLHVSPMLLAGEKMSKSLGNMIFAKDLLKDHDAATIRLALMHYHHRMGGEWQAELLTEAQRLLQRLQVASLSCDDADAASLLSAVRAALDDDINTLEVIDALHRFVGDTQTKERRQLPHPMVMQTLELVGLS